MNIKRIKKLNIGDVFGELTVISDVPEKLERVSQNNKRTIRAVWLCQCSCGEIIKRTSTDLTTKERVNKCTDCAYRSRPQSMLRYSNEERMYNLSIVSRCKTSNGRIHNNLSLEEYTILSKQPCHYCGGDPVIISHLNNNKIAKKVPLLSNGIDRLDSTKHYDKENCVPCCKYCNIMKSTLPVNQFITHVNKITSHYKTTIK